jgi:hypothetical protein
MNKLLLASALLIALSAPALAAYPRDERNTAMQHVGAMREDRAARDTLPRRVVRGEIKDPYWTPCDYSESWTSDSCE